MSCTRINRDTVVEIVDHVLETHVMPHVMTYLADVMNDFKNQIEREYFASTIRFKRDHITISVNDKIDLNQLRRIKIKNSQQTINLQSNTINIDDQIIVNNEMRQEIAELDSL